MNTLIRADGSVHLGLGHIMRCLALAQGLEKIGVSSVFTIRDYEPKVAELIRRCNFEVELIPRGCDLKEDLLLTLELVSQYQVKLIIADLCNNDTLANIDEFSQYLQGLKDGGRFLLTLDDLKAIPFPGDILINPNYGAENWDHGFGSNTKYLLGPAYFIFRQEFIEAARVEREIKTDAKNVLIAIGGSDPFDLTGKVVRVLSKLTLNLHIVLGIDYTESKERELDETLKHCQGNYKLVRVADNLTELMLWADLAITGGGLTKYETAVTGTPSIIIPQVDYLAELVREFEREGTALNLGLADSVGESDIIKAVERLLKDSALRALMSQRGKKLVDGRGIERIISEIPGEVLS
ncbi:UDP-2,4-diacetamido-2,4,6-trideoxy-beta-L-altropyranose hydrolase [Chloroflexota bacterium]